MLSDFLRRQFQTEINWLKTQVLGQCRNFIYGCVPTYVDANTIKIGKGFWVDYNMNRLFAISTAFNISLASSGANGLDTGGEASNAWYYPYLLGNKKSGQVSGCFSLRAPTNFDGPTTRPAYYDCWAYLPFAVRNNASSNIIPFDVSMGWPERPYIRWNVNMYSNAGGAGPTNFINTGTVSTSYATASLVNLVPPISRLGNIGWGWSNTSAFVEVLIRSGGVEVASFGVTYTTWSVEKSVKLNSSQAFEYARASGSTANILLAEVLGFWVDGLP